MCCFEVYQKPSLGQEHCRNVPKKPWDYLPWIWWPGFEPRTYAVSKLGVYNVCKVSKVMYKLYRLEVQMTLLWGLRGFEGVFT